MRKDQIKKKPGQPKAEEQSSIMNAMGWRSSQVRVATVPSGKDTQEVEAGN